MTTAVLDKPLTAYPLESRTLGYDKQGRQFHFKHPVEGQIDMMAMEGMTFFESADGKSGRLRMLNRVAIDDEQIATIWLPEQKCYLDDSVPEDALYAEWWQCCFQRNQERFRIWPKGNQRDMIYFNDIIGPAYVEWSDRGGHIFIHGRIWTATTQRNGQEWTTLYVAGDEP